MTREEIERLLVSMDQKLTLLLVQHKKLPESRESLIAWAQAQPAYQGMDLARFYDKLAAWCQKNNKQMTARRFVNCLNREPAPITAPIPVTVPAPTAGQVSPPTLAPAQPPPAFTPMPLAARTELMEKGLIPKTPRPASARTNQLERLVLRPTDRTGHG